MDNGHHWDTGYHRLWDPPPELGQHVYHILIDTHLPDARARLCSRCGYHTEWPNFRPVEHTLRGDTPYTVWRKANTRRLCRWCNDDLTHFVLSSVPHPLARYPVGTNLQQELLAPSSLNAQILAYSNRHMVAMNLRVCVFEDSLEGITRPDTLAQMTQFLALDDPIEGTAMERTLFGNPAAATQTPAPAATNPAPAPSATADGSIPAPVNEDTENNISATGYR